MEVTVVTDRNKQYLAVLVEAYMDPPGDFKITNKGEVVFRDRTLLERLLNKDTGYKKDFAESVRDISTKIVDLKGNDIPYVQQLCGEALGLILTSNDRNGIIDKLFVAHLIQEQPRQFNQKQQGKQQQQQGQVKEVTVQTVYEQRPAKQAIAFVGGQSQHQLAVDVAELLNRTVAAGEQIIIYQ